MRKQMVDQFLAVASEESLQDFATQFGLAATTPSGDSRIYTGMIEGYAIEIRERWWDPSSVYSIQKDRHEAILFINDQKIASVHFEGGS